MIRVLLVDDHQVVRLGLRSYLETDGGVQVIGEAENGQKAVEQAVELQPDVILMDLLMPVMSGIEAIEEISRRGVTTRIVVLTSSLDDEKMVHALKAGAVGYILKTSPAPRVLEAIQLAAKGDSVLDAQVQERVLGQLRKPTQEPLWKDLTERELEVLRGIARGKSNQEIADWLGIGIKTVKTHVSNIFLKLDVMDRTQAAIYAIRNELDD